MVPDSPDENLRLLARAVRRAGVGGRHAFLGRHERSWVRSILLSEAEASATEGQASRESDYLEIALTLTPASDDYWPLALRLAERWIRAKRADDKAIRLYRRCLLALVVEDAHLRTQMRDAVERRAREK